MLKKVFFLSLICAFITVFALQTAMAADPNWKDNQAKAFKATGLKPGDVINASNWEKVKDCLPPSVANWVKKGEYTLFIDEFKFDYGSDAAYDKKCSLNKGKYTIGPKGEILDAATGKMPTYVQSDPFPTEDIDIKNDPVGVTKFMHNNSLMKFRSGNSTTDFDIQWIGEKGYERALYGWDIFFYYWNRPDGKELPNPQKVKRFEITTMNEPYDLYGNVMLYHYWMDGSPERFVQYIPSIRRVKKMSSTDRSSPFFGTDFCNDDGAGYVGQIEAMKWKFLEEKIILLPMAEYRMDGPDQYVKQPNGSWKSGPAGKQLYGYQKDLPEVQKYGNGVPWQPCYIKWVPRAMYIFQVDPKDPYYATGTQFFYVDKASHSIIFKVTNNKAGSYWKTMTVMTNPSTWGDGNKANLQQIAYNHQDDKTHHCSICSCRGQRGPYYFTNWYEDPNNTPEIYKDDKIATMMK